MSAAQRKRLELDKVDQAELMHFGPFLKSDSADEAEKRSRVMERIWRRRNDLDGNVGGKVKVEVPIDSAGGEVRTEIRVIMPVATEEE